MCFNMQSCGTLCHVINWSADNALGRGQVYRGMNAKIKNRFEVKKKNTSQNHSIGTEAPAK